MSKWGFITAISRKSDKYGDKLLELMERYGAMNLQQITEQQAKEYLEHLQNENHQDEREVKTDASSIKVRGQGTGAEQT